MRISYNNKYPIAGNIFNRSDALYIINYIDIEYVVCFDKSKCKFRWILEPDYECTRIFLETDYNLIIPPKYIAEMQEVAYFLKEDLNATYRKLHPLPRPKVYDDGKYLPF